MNLHRGARLALICCLAITALAAFGQVTPSTPYTVSVFATGVAGSYTKPDSIAIRGSHIFIGYGNNVSTTGSDGKSSTIVEYTLGGDKMRMQIPISSLSIRRPARKRFTNSAPPRTAAAMTTSPSRATTYSSAHPILPTIPITPLLSSKRALAAIKSM